MTASPDPLADIMAVFDRIDAKLVELCDMMQANNAICARIIEQLKRRGQDRGFGPLDQPP
jgi:hypothetical protein